MDTGKVLGDAVKSAAKGTGRFIRDQREAQKVRTEERRRHQAEMARIRAERRARAMESMDKVMVLLREHNSNFSDYPIVLASDLPKEPPVKKCTMSTSFWDCEDPNCWHHSDEKRQRNIGTPTRKFHPDFQQAEAPKDPTTELFQAIFNPRSSN